MNSWTRMYLGSLFVVLTLIGIVPAQDDSRLPYPQFPQSDFDNGNISVNLAASAAAEQVARPREVVRMVRLTHDGSLQGRVRILYPTGKAVPAEATIAFSRSGQVWGTTKTDGEGMFVAASLSPGLYTATVSIETGSTDFGVNVLPYDSAANVEQMTLNATLTPTPELIPEDTLMSKCPTCGGLLDEHGICAHCGEEIVGEEFVDAMPCCGGGFAGGGFGAGGGGWLPLAGLGGLAGLAGLSSDKKVIVASPHAPH